MNRIQYIIMTTIRMNYNVEVLVVHTICIYIIMQCDRVIARVEFIKQHILIKIVRSNNATKTDC